MFAVVRSGDRVERKMALPHPDLRPDFQRKDGFLLIFLAEWGNDEERTFIQRGNRTATPSVRGRGKGTLNPSLTTTEVNPCLEGF